MRQIMTAAMAAAILLTTPFAASAGPFDDLNKKFVPTESTRNCVEVKASQISAAEKGKYTLVPVLLDLTGLPSENETGFVRFEMTGVTPDQARLDEFGHVAQVFKCTGKSSAHHTEIRAGGNVKPMMHNSVTKKYLVTLVPMPTSFVANKGRLASKHGKDNDRYLGQWGVKDNVPFVALTKVTVNAAK